MQIRTHLSFFLFYCTPGFFSFFSLTHIPLLDFNVRRYLNYSQWNRVMSIKPVYNQKFTSSRSSAGKGIIYNRTIKIQLPVAVVTRQTKTRHGETLSDWDILLSKVHRRLFGSCLITGVLWVGWEPEQPLLTVATQQTNYCTQQPQILNSHTQQLQVAGGWNLCAVEN